MEVESSPAPTLAQPQDSGHDASTRTHAGPLDHVYSLDEFLAANPSQPQGENGVPVPVAIGARSSHNIILLHSKCQAYALDQPKYTYGGSSLEGWSVTAYFLDQEFVAEGPFGSKQEAKEVVSGKMMEVVTELEEGGKLKKPEKSKKKKVLGGDGGGAVAAPVEEKKEKEQTPNYAGQLLEFQRATSSPQPTYTDYVLGQSFSCLLTIEGLDQSFGSTTDYFSSKRGARQNAAKCAIEHFKAVGTWPETFTGLGGIKKKSMAPQTPSLADTSTLITTTSYTFRVAQLAHQLGLSTPEWRSTEEAVPNFYTVACYMMNGGVYIGPLGEVPHVFGKKNAKEECARLVFDYLTKMREDRLVASTQATSRIPGKGEVVKTSVGVEAKAAAEDVSDGDEFEDAMEDIKGEAERFWKRWLKTG